MWSEYLYEEIEEEFADLQPETYQYSHRDTLMEPDPAPYLQDEIDPDEWQKYIQLSRPTANVHKATEPTCLCVHTSKRRWKNQHNEGTYLHIISFLAFRWSNQDLQEMSKPQEPPAKKHQEVYPDTNLKTRIQLTTKQKSKNITGQTDNFVIWGKTAQEILTNLLPLKSEFPNAWNPDQTVRVQLTTYTQEKGNYVKGITGNLMLHNAEVSYTAARIKELLGMTEKVSIGAETDGVSVGKKKGNLERVKKLTVEGLPKPENHASFGRGGRGVIYHGEKSQKRRAISLEERIALFIAES